ncbi:CIA30 family protein [Palleronia abyssalis]|uniref:NADH:ubiquinone oxidoreductase intermediate-associated protein 30 domain-containing protein n=1 Tax=Palleronia abyssalis TaxID=1501240 RepID=A0A2R8BXT8_9RHOB|nr:CIA30 family protein [Palleronia abyssalis]SPJ24965.1 hypothetical protein PAA8504_02808 [Palleronia abyssalis]
MEHVIFDAETERPDGWEMVSDRVMGGVSNGALAVEQVGGRPALHLTGTVRLENDGGFLQMARDLDPADGWDGMSLTVFGNGESYNLHLRTQDLSRPWQSFRATFTAPAAWTTHRIAFADLTPHRTDASFDPKALSRMGLVAIGRAFRADLALAHASLWRR